jgi:hypothetical protein
VSIEGTIDKQKFALRLNLLYVTISELKTEVGSGTGMRLVRKHCRRPRNTRKEFRRESIERLVVNLWCFGEIPIWKSSRARGKPMGEGAERESKQRLRVHVNYFSESFHILFPVSEINL